MHSGSFNLQYIIISYFLAFAALFLTLAFDILVEKDNDNHND